MSIRVQVTVLPSTEEGSTEESRNLIPSGRRSATVATLVLSSRFWTVMV
ncbi:MAG: hypothetical protein A4E50_00088 [Methanosaeta sp. PtaB.Bin087]|nr:MAG: hypothetical protein A4E50_00088 [Methanosaeta sp. PtaB.Bin087]